MPGNILAQTGGLPHFREGSVAVVFVQQVAADRCDQDIGVAVVVVVSGICAGTPIRIGQASFFCDVFEVPIPEISEKINAPRRR